MFHRRCYSLFLVCWCGLLSRSVVLCGAERGNVHPQCQPTRQGGSLEAVHIDDVTALLHGNVISAGVCVFNPSVTHLHDNLYLWSARAYTPLNQSFNCVSDYRTIRPLLTLEKWLGWNSVVLAITRLNWAEDGRLTHEIVTLRQFDTPLEDGRLFKDGGGVLWLLAHCPRGGFMTVSRVTASCEQVATVPAGGNASSTGGGGYTGSTAGGMGGASSQQQAVQQATTDMGTATAGLTCHLGLGSTEVLWHTQDRLVEKNWVPHHGTTLMSYPIYPTFTPHAVFDWADYSRPLIKTTFDSLGQPEPFFLDMNATYGRLLEFSGSTPALLEDGGASFLAVGHLRAHGRCFHNPNTSPTSGLGTVAAEATCLGLAEQTAGGTKEPAYAYFDLLAADGGLLAHHFKEYAMFLYRFSSLPPYDLTHISHAFTPCNSNHHVGIVYPAGLTRIRSVAAGVRSDYLISYGDANRYSRLMVMKAATVDELLVPIAQMRREAVRHYSMCTLPCGGSLR